MFGPYLERIVWRRRTARAWQVGFAALIPITFWVHPFLWRLALSSPKAVLPPATHELAVLGVEALANTPTARGSRRSGRVRIRYCWNESGRIADAEVEGHFPGDPEIDEIALRAVRKWRLVPAVIDGVDPCASIDFRDRI